MDENKIDDQEVIETPEEQVEEVTEEETAEEKIARLEKEKQELDEKNKKLYARTKEAESKVKEPVTDGLSAKDFLALKDANITAEDFDEVQEFARYKKISIAEALGNRTLKNILSERADERKTAQATETRSPRIAHKITGEDTLRKAENTGEVPESDDAMRSMLQARLERRKTK